jgi:hypothetical protein
MVRCASNFRCCDFVLSLFEVIPTKESESNISAYTVPVKPGKKKLFHDLPELSTKKKPCSKEQGF